MATLPRSVFADPIHGTISFDNDQELATVLVDIIDTHAFQRMRRISQLGLASHVFPGATHTRFLHSLGAAHLALTVVNHLIATSGSCVAEELSIHKRSIVLAALLHDIGHGPFSHAFERVRCDGKREPLLKHELWTGALITSLHHQLNKHGYNSKLISAMVGKDEIHSLPDYIGQIVSSQLDVDRLDYLPRDAHFSGVSLGRIDIGYLVNSLKVVETGSVRSLGLSSKGVRPFEAFSLARHHMNRSVYYHPKVRVFEFMLGHLLEKVTSSANDQLVPPYLRELGRWDPATQNAADFATSNTRAYTEITDSEIWTLINSARSSSCTAIARLAEGLLTRKPLPFFFIRRGLSERVEEELKRAGLDHDARVLSAESVAYKKKSAAVLIEGRDGFLKPVQELSATIAFYMDRPDGDDILVIVTREREGEIMQLVRPLLELPSSSLKGSIRSRRSSVDPETFSAVSLSSGSRENDASASTTGEIDELAAAVGEPMPSSPKRRNR